MCHQDIQLQNNNGALLPQVGTAVRSSQQHSSSITLLLALCWAVVKVRKDSDPPTQDGGMTYYWNSASITPSLFCKAFWHNPKASHWASSTSAQQVFHSGAASLSRSLLPAKRGEGAHGRLQRAVLLGHGSVKVGCPGPPRHPLRRAGGHAPFWERLHGETASFPGRVRSGRGATRADPPPSPQRRATPGRSSGEAEAEAAVQGRGRGGSASHLGRPGAPESARVPPAAVKEAQDQLTPGPVRMRCAAPHTGNAGREPCPTPGGTSPARPGPLPRRSAPGAAGSADWSFYIT